MIKKIMYNGEVSYIPLPKSLRNILQITDLVDIQLENNKLIITKVINSELNLKKVT